MKIKKYKINNFYDEYLDNKNHPRKSFEGSFNFFDLLTANKKKLLSEVRDSIIRSMGITFRVYDNNELVDREWPLDLIPRIIKENEWNKVKEGLAQRIKAINLFIHDVYHKQDFLNENPVLKSLILDSPNFLKECKGVVPKNKIWANISGTDLIKDHHGKFYVLEDNLRVPSGVAYMLENRNVMKKVVTELFSKYQVSPIDDYTSQLYKCLSNASYSKDKEKTIVILSPGVFNSAYFEHAYLAQQMGIDLVESSDLILSKDNYVYIKTISGRKKVDVIYRRVNDDYLDPTVWVKDSALGLPGIINSWKEKKVAIVNAPGSGVADDKAVYAFVPKMIKFFLNEKPKLNQVKTYLCAFDKDRKFVLDNIDKLVLKPVNESGGYGILIGPNATKKELNDYKSKIISNPRNFVAQPLIKLSTSPTLIKTSIQPRHIDLRPFILSGNDTFITNGGLTRVALEKGSTIVNSSQGGGSKDTWIIH
jgi:uncharacterized circularly permuted ATP-grasp superfamily protein